MVGYKPYFNISLQITSRQTNIHFTLSLILEKDALFHTLKYF